MKVSKFFYAVLQFGGTNRLRFETGRGRHGGRRRVTQGRDIRSNVLQLAQAVCRADAIRSQAAVLARRGECQAEEACRGLQPGQGDATGCPEKKL